MYFIAKTLDSKLLWERDSFQSAAKSWWIIECRQISCLTLQHSGLSRARVFQSFHRRRMRLHGTGTGTNCTMSENNNFKHWYKEYNMPKGNCHPSICLRRRHFKTRLSESLLFHIVSFTSLIESIFDTVMYVIFLWIITMPCFKLLCFNTGMWKYVTM